MRKSRLSRLTFANQSINVLHFSVEKAGMKIAKDIVH